MSEKVTIQTACGSELIYRYSYTPHTIDVQTGVQMYDVVGSEFATGSGDTLNIEELTTLRSMEDSARLVSIREKANVIEKPKGNRIYQLVSSGVLRKTHKTEYLEWLRGYITNSDELTDEYYIALDSECPDLIRDMYTVYGDVSLPTLYGACSLSFLLNEDLYSVSFEGEKVGHNEIYSFNRFGEFDIFPEDEVPYLLGVLNDEQKTVDIRCDMYS